MRYLDGIRRPADLRRMDYSTLAELASEIRGFLITKVSATGGHLGPNLGVVELTMAIHRVFDSPRDPIIFDTGHQAYVHKILTGRAKDFDTLRQQGGLSGYPAREESEHDIVESSHASASLAYADGLAKGFELRGETTRHVVAVIGDGAMTGGMSWEALNNIAEGKNRSVIIIVNDNGRSYSPTIGGWANQLAALRLEPAYEKAMDQTKRTLQQRGRFGHAVFNLLHGVKSGVKDAVVPSQMFSDLGIKYLGPVDGHNLRALDCALKRAKNFGGPVLVHTVTRKGAGFLPAESNEADRMHATGVIDPVTGKAVAASSKSWTSVFSQALIEAGRERDDIVAITAAMAGPTGLQAFADEFPDRFFDVGIAEQHAVASASGLALAGMHPVVALYSTFLNRAFDQLLMDVALLKQPVTLVLDRAGITGPDGASHNGMWDLSVLGIVPGMRVAAPRDPARLEEEFAEAIAYDGGPTAVRFPKGTVGEELEALERLDDGVDVMRRAATGDDAVADVLIVAAGAFVGLAMKAAEELEAEGLTVTVVDPRWILPVPESVVSLAQQHRAVVTLEDSGVQNGFGSAVSRELQRHSVTTPIRSLGIPQRFLAHASRSEILENLRLTPGGVATKVLRWLELLGMIPSGGSDGSASAESAEVWHRDSRS